MMKMISLYLIYGMVLHVQMNRSIHRKLAPEIKTLVILGAAIKENRVNPILNARLAKGGQLLKQFPHLKVILSGGKGTDTMLSEAQLMKNVLIEEWGISPSRIEIEEKSRTTFENLLYVKPLLEEEKIGILTSEFHTIRTAFLTKRMKVEAQVIGARTPPLKRCKHEAREHVALVKSLVFDRCTCDLNK